MGNQRLLQVSPSVRGHAALYFLKTFQETDGSLPITAAQRALLKTATHHLRRSKDRNYSTCPGIDGILKMMSLKQKFYAYNLNTWEVEVGVQQFKVILNLYIKSEARAT